MKAARFAAIRAFLAVFAGLGLRLGCRRFDWFVLGSSGFVERWWRRGENFPAPPVRRVPKPRGGPGYDYADAGDGGGRPIRARRSANHAGLSVIRKVSRAPLR